MLSEEGAHIIIGNLQRLRGPEAAIRMANCACVMLKVLKEGTHHTLLLQARLKDHTKAAKPWLWPDVVLLPIGLELKLVGPTTAYHCLQVFHCQHWRAMPHRQISATHWQGWLQADAQSAANRHLGPAPAAARASDASPPSTTPAPHTVPLANLHFTPAPEVGR